MYKTHCKLNRYLPIQCTIYISDQIWNVTCKSGEMCTYCVNYSLYIETLASRPLLKHWWHKVRYVITKQKLFCAIANVLSQWDHEEHNPFGSLSSIQKRWCCYLNILNFQYIFSTLLFSLIKGLIGDYKNGLHFAQKQCTAAPPHSWAAIPDATQRQVWCCFREKKQSSFSNPVKPP